MVIHAFAPVFGVLALQQRQERGALNVGGHGHTCYLQEGGRVVNVLHHLLYVAAGFKSLGQTHYEGRRERLFVHKTLVEPSVLAHVEALVAGVDHEGVVEQAGLLEVVEGAPHVVVERLEHLGVVPHVALVLELGQLFACEVAAVEVARHGFVHVVVALEVGTVEAAYHFEVEVGEACADAGAVHLRVVDDVHVAVVSNLHLLLLCGEASFVLIVEGFGHGEGFVLVGGEVLHFRQPASVAGLVVDEEGKGFALVAAMLHPVDGLVGDDVGNVSMLTHRVVLHGDEVGVVVVALSRQHVPVVEARRQAFEVPLTDDGCLVARLLQEFGHGLLRAVEDAVLVVREAVLVGVLTRKHAGS